MATVLGANTLSTGSFDVANSVRMNRGSTEHLRRTNNTGETSNKIGTYSGWVKRSTIALDGMMFEGKDLDANNYTQIYFQATGKLTVYGSGSSDIVSTALFRDPTAWYHVCVAIDTTQGTAANRVKIYVNGVQLTSLTNGNGDAADYPDQNDVIYFAVNGDQQAIGIREDGALLWNGYFSEVVYIDGAALAPTSFGEFDEDSGIWKPIKVSGLTFGNNGCYLDFQDSSALGNVVAGRTSVDFTATNLTAVDQSTDTCTNNFATLNPLDNFFPNHTYSDGNLTSASGTADGSPYTYVTSTMGFNTGKWYWEFKAVAKESGIDNWVPGFTSQRTTTTTLVNANNTHGYGMYGHSGVIYNDGSSAYGSGFTTGNIVMIAVDMDNLGAYWGVNGTWLNSSDPESGSSRTGAKVITAPTGDIGVYLPSWFWYEADVNGTASFNFGSPSYAISSGNADGNGFGNFEYAVPSGYFALCTKNLAENG